MGHIGSLIDINDHGSILSGDDAGDMSINSDDMNGGSGMFEDEELDDISQTNRSTCKKIMLLESVY